MSRFPSGLTLPDPLALTSRWVFRLSICTLRILPTLVDLRGVSNVIKPTLA